MKKILFLIMITPLFSFGQQKETCYETYYLPGNPTEIDTIVFEKYNPKVHRLISWDLQYEKPYKDSALFREKNFSCYRLNERVFSVSYIGNDTTMNVYDSLATIKTMLEGLQQLSKQFEGLSKKCYAAEEILLYLKVSGEVTNRKKFNAAVKKYKAIKAESQTQ